MSQSGTCLCALRADFHSCTTRPHASPHLQQTGQTPPTRRLPRKVIGMDYGRQPHQPARSSSWCFSCHKRHAVTGKQPGPPLCWSAARSAATACGRHQVFGQALRAWRRRIGAGTASAVWRERPMGRRMWGRRAAATAFPAPPSFRRPRGCLHHVRPAASLAWRKRRLGCGGGIHTHQAASARMPAPATGAAPRCSCRGRGMR